MAFDDEDRVAWGVFVLPRSDGGLCAGAARGEAGDRRFSTASELPRGWYGKGLEAALQKMDRLKREAWYEYNTAPSPYREGAHYLDDEWLEERRTAANNEYIREVHRLENMKSDLTDPNRKYRGMDLEDMRREVRDMKRKLRELRGESEPGDMEEPEPSREPLVPLGRRGYSVDEPQFNDWGELENAEEGWLASFGRTIGRVVSRVRNLVGGDSGDGELRRPPARGRVGGGLQSTSPGPGARVEKPARAQRTKTRRGVAAGPCSAGWQRRLDPRRRIERGPRSGSRRLSVS